MFTAHLLPDTILTLSTSTSQTKGSYSNIAPSKPFPIPYRDDFESKGQNSFVSIAQNFFLIEYNEYSEADYFADQTGVWEIRQDSIGTKGKVMEQV